MLASCNRNNEIPSKEPISFHAPPNPLRYRSCLQILSKIGDSKECVQLTSITRARKEEEEMTRGSCLLLLLVLLLTHSVNAS
jgi:hypothetical protein